MRKKGSIRIILWRCRDESTLHLVSWPESLLRVTGVTHLCTAPAQWALLKPHNAVSLNYWRHVCVPSQQMAPSIRKLIQIETDLLSAVCKPTLQIANASISKFLNTLMSRQNFKKILIIWTRRNFGRNKEKELICNLNHEHLCQDKVKYLMGIVIYNYAIPNFKFV